MSDAVSPSQILSVPIDPSYVIENEGFDVLVSQIATEIDTASGRRKRSKMELERLTAALRALLLNLILAHENLPGCTVGIDLNRSKYAATSRYAQRGITYRPMIQAYEGLRTAGLIEIAKKGLYAPSAAMYFNTKIRATPSLIERIVAIPDFSPDEIEHVDHWHADIELRDAMKKPIQFDPTPETEAKRANIGTINAVLRDSKIAMDLLPGDLIDLNRRMIGTKLRRPFDPRKRTLVRKFNDASFQRGGRFFQSSWQNMPKEYRPYLTIDGYQTVEVDYVGLHPSMLYASRSMPIPADVYDAFPDAPPIVRIWVKKTFNALINDKRGWVRQPHLKSFDLEEGYDETVLGVTRGEFVERVKLHFAPLSDLFHTGVGKTMQFWESQLAETVMLHFADEGIPVLPVHDSFIIAEERSEELQRVMVQVFQERFGVLISLKITDRDGKQMIDGSNLMDASLFMISDGKNDYPLRGAYRKELV